MKLFGEIRNIIEHKHSLVCVLIDEVESIAFARNSISCKRIFCLLNQFKNYFTYNIQFYSI